VLGDIQVIWRLLDNLAVRNIRACFQRFNSVLDSIQLLIGSLHLPDQYIIRLRGLLAAIYEGPVSSLRVAELALVIALRESLEL